MTQPSLPRLIVGLGNPASSYALTRHSVGREFVEKLAEESGKSFKKIRQAERFSLPDFFGISLPWPVIVVRLASYMNESGPALEGLLERENVDAGGVLIILDDFMIPFGSLRLRTDGSDGGHNGLKSIIETLGTENIPRLRIGIGPVPEGEDPAAYVLKKFSKTELKRRPEIFATAEEGLKTLFQDGYQRAMSALNKQPKGAPS